MRKKDQWILEDRLVLILSAPPSEFNTLTHKPDVVNVQLLLYVFGEEKSGAGVTAQAVRHNKDQRAPTSPHKTPAGNTHTLISCLCSFLHSSGVYEIRLFCLT